MKIYDCYQLGIELFYNQVMECFCVFTNFNVHFVLSYSIKIQIGIFY
jgi:hypothetical protein